MTRAVFDSNVVIGGVIWRGESHLCLSRWRAAEKRDAGRSVRKLDQLGRALRDPSPSVDWFSYTARLVEPAPTGKPRSRDPKDDPILGTALAAGVRTIITFDNDLLVLEKPFGIEILRPGPFLQRLA